MIYSPFDPEVKYIIDEFFEETPCFSDDEIPFRIKFYKIGGNTGSYKNNKIFIHELHNDLFPNIVRVYNNEVYIGYDIKSTLRKFGFENYELYNINAGRVTIDTEYQVILSLLKRYDEKGNVINRIIQFTLIDVNSPFKHVVFHLAPQFTKYEYSHKVIDVLDSRQKLYSFFFNAILYRLQQMYDITSLNYNNVNIMLNTRLIDPYAFNNFETDEDTIIDKTISLYEEFMNNVDEYIYSEICEKLKTDWHTKKDCRFELYVGRMIEFRVKVFSNQILFNTYGEALPITYRELYGIDDRIVNTILDSLIKTFLY